MTAPNSDDEDDIPLAFLKKSTSKPNASSFQNTDMLQNEHNYFNSNLIPDDPMTLLDRAKNNLYDSTLSTSELSDMINYTSIQKRGRKKVRDESSWKRNIKEKEIQVRYTYHIQAMLKGPGW